MTDPQKNQDERYRLNLLHHHRDALDFGAFQREVVLNLEKEINPETLDEQTVKAMLRFAVASGDVIDLYKKIIVYEQTDKLRELLEATIESKRALQEVDDALTSMVVTPRAVGLKRPLNLRLFHASLGMFGESAEILNALRKEFETGTLDIVNVGEELGDSGHYDAMAHSSVGLTKYSTLGRNYAKLSIRYPGMKWDRDRVINRDLASERTALEGR